MSTIVVGVLALFVAQSTDQNQKYADIVAIGATVSSGGPFAVIVSADGELVNDNTVELFTAHSEIDALQLLNCNISDVGAGKLVAISDLRSLNLSRTKVTGSCFSRWKKTNLRFLILSHCPVSPEGVIAICALHDLETLSIYNTPAGDESLSKIAMLPKLKSLAIGKTKISNVGLKHLAIAKQLTTLSVRHCNIDNHGIRELSKISLKHLDIDGTAVDDDAIEHLVAISSLTRLSLSKTKITPKGIDKLRKSLPSATILD